MSESPFSIAGSNACAESMPELRAAVQCERQLEQLMASNGLAAAATQAAARLSRAASPRPAAERCPAIAAPDLTGNDATLKGQVEARVLTDKPLPGRQQRLQAHREAYPPLIPPHTRLAPANMQLQLSIAMTTDMSSARIYSGMQAMASSAHQQTHI